MVLTEFLVPGAIIEHARTGRYTVLSNTVKMRDVTTQEWSDAVRYCNDKGEEFVRASHDFASFTPVTDEAVPLPLADLDNLILHWQREPEPNQIEYSKVLTALRAYRNLLVWQQQAMKVLRRCLPIVRDDAQMMADITRHAPLEPRDQASHDSTEYESENEKLVREIPSLLAMINEYEASPEFQLEQPHPTADERAACDEITAAARRGALALVVCPQANGWTPTKERWPEHGQVVNKRWRSPDDTTLTKVGAFNVKAANSFTEWCPLPPDGPQRVLVLASIMRNHDEVMYQPLARLLNGREWLGQPALEDVYITADNRSAFGE